MLQIDASLIVQIANFLILLFLMNRLLYRPIRKILAERHRQMQAFETAIEDYRDQAEKRRRDLEEGLMRVRKEGYQERESFKLAGREQERGILQEAGASVEEKLTRAKKELEARMAEVRQALEAQTAGFSKELAEKILGRSL